MGTPGKTIHSLKKPLGLQMKGSPYSMNQPLHGNAFIGAKVKAEQQGKNSFDVGGETFQVKKSAAPKFIGALIGGAVAKTATKTLAGKALSAIGGAASKAVSGIGGAAKTAVSGIGEGIGGVAEGLKEKVGGGGKGAFKEKVKNYIGSLDLITNSNPDGSLRKDAPSTSEDSDKNITKLSGPGDVSTTGQTVGADLKIPNTNISMDKSAVANKQKQDRGIIGGKDYSKDLGGPEMGGPLNKIKNMCRG